MGWRLEIFEGAGGAMEAIVRHSPRFSEDRPAGTPSLSADGRVVAFELVGSPIGERMGSSDIYLVER
jgi:hypothetical protein